MRILVSGSRGKVGSATVDALHRAGHEVTACDLGAPVFEASEPGAPCYIQADLTDAGQAFAALRGHDAVIHAAAIPEPTRNAPHIVFRNNLMSAFNTLEAAIRLGVGRYVNVSSETVPGFFFPEREFLPDYAPVDEEHPVRPQDPYATAKHFSEQLMDAAMRRSDIRCLTIRPSWVQWEGNYATNLARALRDPEDTPSASFWSYIDVYDLADALRLAAESELDRHEVLYIASPDNHANRALAELIRHHHGDAVALREPLPREDASGISCAKAERVIGYAPTRSWRDYLWEDGTLRAEPRERLEREATGVQRGRAVG
ncbi:MAG TPA: NAD(P)-dependent oxidoreductase [Solirubrobacteraceae bacterium]|nr:NAD(P)-dependent oxidoreductase [Solirubrobacteraceae bacterium]